MFLKWRGRGWLVPVFAFGFSLAGNLICNAVYGEQYYDTHEWPLALTLLVSGTVCGVVGLALMPRSDLAPIDRPDYCPPPSPHRFLFIPMHWWGLLLFGAGAALLIHAAMAR